MKKKRITSQTFFIIAVNVFALVACVISASAENLLLTIGQQETIKVPGVARIAVGDQKVADVKALEGADLVLVTAKGVGRTNLIIWDIDEKQTTVAIEVIATDPNETAAEIRALLENIQGISIRPLGKKIVIDGYVLKSSDLEKIQKISAMYPDAMNLATLSPAVIDMVVSHINREFTSNGWEHAKAKRMAKLIALEGDVSSELEKQKAEMIAKAYYGEIINFIKVGVEIQQLINISVDFVELSNDDKTKVGINWGDGLSIGSAAAGGGSFGSAVSSAFTGTYGVVANYNVTINALKGKGKSRILAQPKLLCRSGEKAEFLAGGEIGVPIVTSDTTSVEYKEYGMILKISPTADKNGNIETAIEIENSSIAGFASNGAPSFHTSRVQTFVNGKNNQTIVLSGIINQSQTKSVDKMPLLGDIPILGELFKSREFQNNNSELLIFITPTIVGANSEKMNNEAQGMKQRFHDAADDMKFKLLD